MYPIDLCSLFMRNLHDDVKAVFQELYPAYVDPVPLNGRTQRTTLAIILRHATNAENRVISTQRLVARQVGQTFLADSYASQAEKTLSRYNTPTNSPTKPSPTKTTTGTPRLGEGQTCHGCGSPHHPFSQCPQKDDPTIKAIARKNYDKQHNARRSDEGGAARKRWAAKNPNLDICPLLLARRSPAKCLKLTLLLRKKRMMVHLSIPPLLVALSLQGTLLPVVVAQALAVEALPAALSSLLTLLRLLLATRKCSLFLLPAFSPIFVSTSMEVYLFGPLSILQLLSSPGTRHSSSRL
jgi:hypothetical protein